MKVSFSRRRLLVVAIACSTLLGLGSAIVFANHDFSDVPTSAYYHDEVSWIVDRGITAGCGGGKYCPDNAVKRGDMAVFLNNLGKALEPTLNTKDEAGGILDIDADPVVCQTSAVSTGGFGKIVTFNGHFSGYNGGASDVEWLAQPVYSTNGGSTWTVLFNQTLAEAPQGTSNDNDWDSVPVIGDKSFGAGVSLRFGIRVERSIDDADEFDFEKYSCLTQAVLHNDA